MNVQVLTIRQGCCSIRVGGGEIARASNRQGVWTLYTPEPDHQRGPDVTHLIHNHQELAEAATAWRAARSSGADGVADRFGRLLWQDLFHHLMKMAK